MFTQALPTPPTSPHLPPQAHLFLTARLANQSSTLTNLETQLTSLRHKHAELKAQHPSILAKPSFTDKESFTHTANAQTTEEGDQIGRDFDTQFGTNYHGGWVKTEVLKTVKQGTENVFRARVDVMELEHMCRQFERGEGGWVGGLGGGFERGSHPDVEEEEEEEEEDDGGRGLRSGDRCGDGW